MLYRVNGSCMSVRLTDGALSSNIFPHDYHSLDRANSGYEELLPVKWMAIELLTRSGHQHQPRVAHGPETDVVSSYIAYYMFRETFKCSSHDT